MILTCASCATRYYADEGSIPPQGRQVRCAACGNTWRVERELVLDNAAAPQPASFVDEQGLTREQIERARKESGATPGASTTTAFRAKQLQRQKLERLRAAAYAWGGAGASLVALLAIAVVFRDGVARAWPNTASAYAAVGLNVNITGLEFSDLQITRDNDSAAPTLTVTGSVRNIGPKPKKPPVLRFSLRDQNADEVRTWMASLAGPEIQPGGARQFQSVLAGPPLSAVDLEATFATAKEAEHAPAPQAFAAHPVAPAPAAKADPHSVIDGHRSATGSPGSVPGLTVITPSGETHAAPAAGAPAPGAHPAPGASADEHPATDHGTAG
jgi:predicted Zn finger-like uncharacterized protein